ncbi:MAG: UDP-N-acetylmuramate dehydrogenase [Ignavibacteria bacterium]|jgi:UDP-N-acetylmuramate dehydrogenase|nr:UDP-N-acetylmuramate dehydrogenase [Ignavibacteria bacterium]MDH7527382.1 UDP-N-acetylmuramate dehydrogenase [Ignavibacteria bacterium]
MFSVEKVKEFFKGNISISEPLSRFTTFRIGGPADYYLEPKDRDDLLKLIKYLKEINYPYIIIGNGSNILISDDGIRGAAINLEYGFTKIEVMKNKVFAEAGIRLSKLVDVCIEHSLVGIENLAGIPGTLGGAILMNAGAYGGEISDYIKVVEVLDGTEIKFLKKEECGFSYRKSNLEGKIILSAEFELPFGDKTKAKERRKELLLKRNQSQPVELPNAGSIFKNPSGDYAARLIEQAGLKGLTIGGAKVSEKHANFIVNFNNASANDVLELMKIIRQTVFQKFGIMLEPEIKMIGFDKDRVKVQ